MARPTRNNVDYFPHYIGHGTKMFYLEQKYGNDGYATWFKIMERLGKTGDHYLDLNAEEEAMFLSAYCRIDEKTLYDIIEILVKFKWFDAELWHDHRVLFSQEFIDSIEDAYKKRNNGCINRMELLARFRDVNAGFRDGNGLKGGINPQRKEKDRIEKESKEEETRGDIIHPFDTPEYYHAWAAFKRMRKKEHGAEYLSQETEQATLRKLARLAKTPDEAVAIIMQSIENGWKHIYELKTQNNGKHHNGTGGKSVAEGIAELLKERGLV